LCSFAITPGLSAAIIEQLQALELTERGREVTKVFVRKCRHARTGEVVSRRRNDARTAAPLETKWTGMTVLELARAQAYPALRHHYASSSHPAIVCHPPRASGLGK
jgi:hypothetical protein